MSSECQVADEIHEGDRVKVGDLAVTSTGSWFYSNIPPILVRDHTVCIVIENIDERLDSWYTSVICYGHIGTICSDNLKVISERGHPRKKR